MHPLPFPYTTLFRSRNQTGCSRFNLTGLGKHRPGSVFQLACRTPQAPFYKMREDDKENKDLRQGLAKFPRELLEEALAMREETDSDEQPSPPTAEVRSILHSRTFSGPLPPPDILDHYYQVVDEGAKIGRAHV